MVQRIQSLWLLLASLSVCLLFIFSVATFEPNPEYANANKVEFGFYAHKLDCAQPFETTLDELNLYAPLLKWTVIIVVLACVLTPFFSIFMYKNRPKQVQLSRLTILLNAALTVTFFMLSDSFAEKTYSFATYGVGVYAPIAAVIFLLLAIRFIKKDDKLVRSADRIR